MSLTYCASIQISRSPYNEFSDSPSWYVQRNAPGQQWLRPWASSRILYSMRRQIRQPGTALAAMRMCTSTIGLALHDGSDDFRIDGSRCDVRDVSSAMATFFVLLGYPVSGEVDRDRGAFLDQLLASPLEH
jgi:hypothetical protein